MKIAYFKTVCIEIGFTYVGFCDGEVVFLEGILIINYRFLRELRGCSFACPVRKDVRIFYTTPFNINYFGIGRTELEVSWGLPR